MQYDELLAKAEAKGIVVEESALEAHDGLYCDGLIFINQKLETQAEKTCVLAEELGHYYTSVGNIIDQTETENRKQELRARMWAYNDRVGLIGIVRAYRKHCTTLYEMAKELE